MKFEGTQVNIPIKGIMRAGTDNLCADGAMNEVIGMEYKDGSWLPYKTKDQKVRVQIWNEDNDAYEDLNNVSKVYVHKSSNSSSRRLFLTADRILAYEVNSRTFQDYIIIETKALSYRVNSVEMVGNIVCIATDTGLEYYLWSSASEEYRLYQPKDFYESLPIVKFRVTDFDSEKQMEDEYGTQGSVIYARSAQDTYWHSELPQTDENKRNASSVAMKAVSFAHEKGRLTGTFIVCYAYRLKGGGYIMASAPVLMGFPCQGTTKDVGGELYVPSSAFYDSGSYYGEFADSTTRTAWDSDLEPQISEKAYSYNGTFRFEPDGQDQWAHTQINTFKKMPSLYGYLHNRRAIEDVQRGASYLVVECISNLLQYKISENISNIHKEQIDSLCIFISDQISNYEEFKAANVTIKTFKLGSWSANYLFAEKSMQDIIDGVKGLKTLYCVKSIPIGDVIASSNWETVDLKGKLGDALFVQESLPLSAINMDTILNGNLDVYNSKLHVYNYKEKKFGGHGIQLLRYSEGLGQPYEGQIPSDIYCVAYTKTTINATDGEVVVWKQLSNGTSWCPGLVNPIISYPDVRATKIELFYKKNSENIWRKRTFNLIANNSLNTAYYINSGMMPFDLFSDASSEISEQPVIEDIGGVSEYKNAIRVTETYFVTYFPLRQTYTIGNDEIIGLAKLAIPLSQDTFGRYPLIVFCKDGIYSLNADDTGNGAYTNITPFSREVCINKNTICEIDGAVVFASDKGLMVATQNGVEEFCPQLNGKIRFVPDDSGDNPKSGAAIYNKMITEQHIVKLSVNTVDFLDFLGEPETVVSYISKKNKVIVYNKQRRYVYIIDIPTRNATKLHTSIAFDDDNYPDEIYWQRPSELVSNEYISKQFLYQSQDGYIDCLVQSRPIKIQQDDKCSYRVVITGYMEGNADDWAELVVLGSLDAEHWRVIGVKEKKLNGGFHNLGCLTERGSWKYLMFIFAGRLSEESHIDSIDITVNGKYNNKKR